MWIGGCCWLACLGLGVAAVSGAVLGGCLLLSFWW